MLRRIIIIKQKEEKKTTFDMSNFYIKKTKHIYAIGCFHATKSDSPKHRIYDTETNNR